MVELALRAHLLLLQVVADGEVPVARLSLRLEPGSLGGTRPLSTAFTHKALVRLTPCRVCVCVWPYSRGVAEAHVFVSGQFVHEVHHLHGAAAQHTTHE